MRIKFRTLKIWATAPVRGDIQRQSCKDNYESDLIQVKWLPSHKQDFLGQYWAYKDLLYTKLMEISRGFCRTLQIWATSPEKGDIQRQSCKDNYESDRSDS